MFRSVLRVPTSRFTPRFPIRAAVTNVRFNSTSTPAPNDSSKEKLSDEDISTPDEVADRWIKAIQELREEVRAHGYTKPMQRKSEYVEKYGVDPTPEQLEKVESLAEKPIPSKKDLVVEHCTNMIMNDGKKARAQRVMAEALYIVRLQLRKDPVEVLTEILNRMAPLMAIKTQKNRTAKSILLPVPLTERQRHRTAFQWILEGTHKRRSPSLSVRLGEELIAAYEGKSTGYDKRLQIHKTAMLQRAYVKLR